MRIIKKYSVLDRLLAFSSLLIILLIIIIIVSKKNVRGVESNVVYTIERILSDNSALYEDIRKAPYSVTQYSPLYYMISDFNLTVINASTKKNAHFIRLFLRTQNLLFFTLIIFTGIKLIEVLRKARLNRKEQIIFALLFTSLTIHWHLISRPDVLVSLFFVSSIYFLTLGIEKNKNLYVIVAGAISLMAFLSKQNGLLLLLFTGGFLLFQNRLKDVLYYILGIVTSMFLFAAYYYSFNYPIAWIMVNLVDGVANGFDVYLAINNAIIPFIAIFGFPFLVCIALVYEKRKMLATNFGLLYISFFSLICLGFALITSLKVGSAENYFNDFILLIIIIVFAIGRENLSKKVMIACIFYSISCGIYQLLKYSPRSIYFTFSNKHHKELNYCSSFVENLNDGKFFYSNIRNLTLDYPDYCVFPQFEIFSSSLSSGHSNSIYQDVFDNVDYNQIELIIIDTNIDALPLNLTMYRMVDEYLSIKVYKKLTQQ